MSKSKSKDSKSKASRGTPVPANISYKLSQLIYIDLGWTKLLTEEMMCTILTMKTKFSREVLSSWFKPRDQPLSHHYSNGKVALSCQPDGTGCIFYPNGHLAVRITRGGKDSHRTHILVKTPGGVDREGITRPRTTCALFDSLGQGVVLDYTGRKRLLYTQDEIVVWNSSYDLLGHWDWHHFDWEGSMKTINEDDEPPPPPPEPPATPKSGKSKSGGKTPKSDKKKEPPPPPPTPPLPTPEDPTQYLNTARPRPFDLAPSKPIVMRLCEHVALRVLDQANISLSFTAGRELSVRLEIGVLYNPYKKLKVTKLPVEVLEERFLSPFEVFPAKTHSMEVFQKTIKRNKNLALKPSIQAQ